MPKVTHGIERPRNGTGCYCVRLRPLLCQCWLSYNASYSAKATEASLTKIREGIHPYFCHFPVTSCRSYHQKGRALLGDKNHAIDLGNKYFPCPLLAPGSLGECGAGGWGVVSHSTTDSLGDLVRRTFLSESQFLLL